MVWTGLREREREREREKKREITWVANSINKISCVVDFERVGDLPIEHLCAGAIFSHIDLDSSQGWSH